MKSVFDSTTVNGLELKNRLVRSATWEGLADPDGGVNEALVDVHRGLADGGVGLIITGYMAVRTEGRQSPTQLLVESDDRIPGLLTLLGAALLVVLAASGMKNLRFTTNYRVFFSEENPQLQALEAVNRELKRQPVEVQLRRRLERLGPTYIKLGQILSLREDLLPKSITDELQNLLDRLPVVTFERFQELIENDLGFQRSQRVTGILEFIGVYVNSDDLHILISQVLQGCQSDPGRNPKQPKAKFPGQQSCEFFRFSAASDKRLCDHECMLAVVA